jgi:glycosyltransferase involved in cell wall biosynthesis
MMPCNVSVIVTAYNRRSTLGTCLRLLAEQSYREPWELVICDDGSSDDLLAEVREIFAGGSPRCRYVWQPRVGERRAHSRNNGLRYARGKIIIFVDGDFAVGPAFVEQHVASHLEAGPGSRLVYGARKWVFERDVPSTFSTETYVRGLIEGTISLDLLYSEVEFQQKYASTAHAWLGCLGCNFSLIRRDEIFFDERFCGWGAEDQEFACRLKSRYGYALDFRPSISGFHIDPGSRSGFCPVRPSVHEDIVHYLRNVLHFRNAYPDLDMMPACRGLAYFNFDRDRDVWEKLCTPRFDMHIRKVLELAEVMFGTSSSAT